MPAFQFSFLLKNDAPDIYVVEANSWILACEALTRTKQYEPTDPDATVIIKPLTRNSVIRASDA